jgi:glycerol-3-phosphate dehydrogenase
MRPAWMIRAGLFLYDHLARREILPPSHAVDLRVHPAGRPLKTHFTRGFVYSDGWVDDARLVVLAAVDAAARGASVATRCCVVRAERSGAGWSATLQHRGGLVHRVDARALVNAAGPWAAQFLREHAGLPDTRALRLVKGSHIVVRRLFEHDHAYIFQNRDKRIIFAIPYEGDFTLVGTTDVEHTGPVGDARIDAAETRYLCEQASRYFARPVVPGDVVWSYAGVRPLLDDENASDAASVTRDYLLELDNRGPVPGGSPAGAPLLSVWGGKITTFRKLAEEAADMLCGALGVRGRAWTAGAPLPGGDLSAWIGAPRRPDTDLLRFDSAVAAAHPELPDAVRRRWVRAYGSRIGLLLDGGPLGQEIAPSLHEAELRYLHAHEWAASADDVLWRRSKLGLHLTPDAAERVEGWMAARNTQAAGLAGTTEAARCN